MFHIQRVVVFTVTDQHQILKKAERNRVFQRVPDQMADEQAGLPGLRDHMGLQAFEQTRLAVNAA